MKFIRDVTRLQESVGATAETRLVTLTPLIEFYEREMGDLPGRLMIATSFLGDLQHMQEGEGCGCGGGDDNCPAAEVQRLLDQL